MEGDVLAHVELFDGAQAQLVVLGQVVLGAEHIQVEVHEALVAQHREGANQVGEALNGHHAGDKHEAPHVAASLGEDARTRRLAGVVGFSHGLDEHAVGQDDGAVLLALVHLVDGRTDAARLLQCLGVQVGGHIGARVAEATHLQEPDGPGSLVKGDGAQARVLTLLSEESVVGGNRLRHVALELGVDGVANVQVVLGQQEAGAVVTGGSGSDESRVAGGVGVVHAGVGHPLVQQRKEDGNEVAHLPEELAEGNLAEEPEVGDNLHELAGTEEPKEVVGAGGGVDALVVELPEGVDVAGNERVEALDESISQLSTLRHLHVQAVGIALGGEGSTVDVEAQVDHLNPLDVLGHAVEILVRRVLIPRDVDNAEGEVGVLRDDIVHHRGDATLEVGVGGLHDDGDIDIRVLGIGVVLSGLRKLQRSIVVSVHLFSHWLCLSRAVLRGVFLAGPAERCLRTRRAGRRYQASARRQKREYSGDCQA